MKDLTPELIGSLTAEQVELLAELGELAKLEADLTHKIEAIRKQEERVGLGRENRRTKAFYEDSEFDNLLSMKAVRERQAVRGKIAGLMRSIVKAGLGELGIIRRQAANYGVDLEPGQQS